MARTPSYVRFEVPEVETAAIIDLGPIIDPPFRDGIVWEAPSAALKLVDVPFEVLPDRPGADASARARATAAADPRVVAALGRRWEFIGVAVTDHKYDEPPGLRVVWYAYDTDQRVEAGTDDDGAEVRYVAADTCQPALTKREEDRANELVAKSGRLPDVRCGRGILVEITDPGNPRYGHRLVDLRFDPYVTRLPRWWAVVDLSAGELVDAGDVPESAK